MFILQAPYPPVSTTTILPNPKWGDSTALKATLVTLRATDGTLYTYIKNREGKKKYRWDFEIARHKAVELELFINSYFRDMLKITDHNGNIIIGYLKNNPFEFVGDSRAKDWPGNETMTIILELEEK